MTAQRGDFDAPTPVPATARDTWRDQLAKAFSLAEQVIEQSNPVVIWEHAGASRQMRAYDFADALLPVLVTAQREAAAEALEEAADQAQDHGTVDEDWAVDASELRERASALRAGGE